MSCSAMLAAVLTAAVITTLSTPATARPTDAPHDARVVHAGADHGDHDEPLARRSSARTSGLDTVYFGGRGPDGRAIQGGVWDFEDGTLQGWTSIDVSDVSQVDPPGDPSVGGPGASYFRRITAADFTSDPPLIHGVGSVWVGANDEEAAALCWPGGLGYGNDWVMGARKTFTYGGSGDVTMTFDYFTDSETQFDYTYVYVEVDGVRSTPLNTSAWSTPEGWGYSGAYDEGTSSHTPDDPATDSIVVDVADLPTGPGAPFDVIFEFDSDGLYSDGLDYFIGYLNSRFGAFGMDDFTIAGTGLSDTDTFETDAEGWSFERAAPVGTFMQVVALSELDPIEDDCDCPILLDDENEYVMLASDWDLSHGPFHHPDRQRERLTSSAAYVGSGSGVEGYDTYFVAYDSYEDTPVDLGVGYRIAMDYYPWTCPETGVVGWTLLSAGDGGHTFSGLGGARCATFLADNGEFMPAAVDSVRLTFELLSSCASFGYGETECNGPEGTNQTPLWDDVRLGLAYDALDAPSLSAELTYQDAFPTENSLLPTATADVHSYFDTRRSDGDDTNAALGDSATVYADDGAAVFLNFRVTPGPGLADAALDDLLIANGGEADGPGDAVDDGGFLEVRMTEVPGSASPRFATYRYDGDPYDGTQPKILPDGLFTPGTTVEYFFSARDAAAPVDTRVEPDTTAGDEDPSTSFFLEFEVLPSMRQVSLIEGGTAVVTSSVLYVDAYDHGAQAIIEGEGLRPFLGTGVGMNGLTFDRWDRYDYQEAASNVVAPMARELHGDNGMTRFQSLVYRTMLINTGTFRGTALRERDADLLAHWLTSQRPDDDGSTRGLWLSGDGIARILGAAGRPHRNALLAMAGATFGGDPYRTVASPDDPSFCVRLDAAPGSVVTPAGGGRSVRGSGCPTELGFSVVGTTSGGAGDLVYVDQDAGEGETAYASVSRTSESDPFATVVDGFSLHVLRRSPAGWTGDGDPGSRPGDGVPCADYAVLDRVEDVFGFFEVPTDPMVDPSVFAIATPPGDVRPRTALYATAPNPFNPVTTIRYTIGESTRAHLAIYDVSGRLVRTLVDGIATARHYTARWDGADDSGAPASAGVYWARLRTGTGFVGSTKLVLVK